MPTFQIIDRHGETLNTIEASQEFMAEHYPPAPIIADNTEGPDEFWQQYREVPQVAVPEAIVVPMHKAREALIRSGVSIATINAAIDAIADDTERELARNAWEYSPTVSSTSALVVTLGAALGLNVDALFQYARALP
jgi:fatty acid/phospholipid biosynthesis enzyme